MAGKDWLIDTHQHIFPPQIKDLVEGTPLAQGFQGPQWSPEAALSFMSMNCISASIVSCAIPLTVFKKSPEETAILAREINTYMASLRDKNPSRFGFFAILPSLEYADACINEIRFAMQTLGADGVALFTSYNDKYLGDPEFQPVWAELDALSAVMFIHPTMEGMEKSIKSPFLIPRALMDWSHETSRTAVHMVMTSVTREYSRCKIILSHGGGTLPFIAARVSQIPVQAKISGNSPDEFMEGVKSFWFDTALMGDDAAPLRLLLDFAPKGKVLYGSDYPFVREPGVVSKLGTIRGMEDKEGNSLGETTRLAALELFPRFAE